MLIQCPDTPASVFQIQFPPDRKNTHGSGSRQAPAFFLLSDIAGIDAAVDSGKEQTRRRPDGITAARGKETDSERRIHPQHGIGQLKQFPRLKESFRALDFRGPDDKVSFFPVADKFARIAADCLFCITRKPCRPGKRNSTGNVFHPRIQKTQFMLFRDRKQAIVQKAERTGLAEHVLLRKTVNDGLLRRADHSTAQQVRTERKCRQISGIIFNIQPVPDPVSIAALGSENVEPVPLLKRMNR